MKDVASAFVFCGALNYSYPGKAHYYQGYWFTGLFGSGIFGDSACTYHYIVTLFLKLKKTKGKGYG